MPARKLDVRKWYPEVAARARFRCEYCRAPEALFPHRFTLDHIKPESQGGPSDPSNLALCCYACQFHKQDFQSYQDPGTKRVVPLFHPRRHRWSRHFRWSRDGLRIEGLTPIGRASVERLALNHLRQVEARRH
ncbi:MAG: HNH endonuclease [Planctomycetes bacterium]|nr:HNH endonuclease [Planctomycetota bacterium]